MQLVLFLCLLGYVASLRTKGIGQQNSLVGVLGMASGGTSDNSNDMMMPGYDPQKIALQIRYCGGWGYEKYYLQLREALEEKFPGRIEYFSVKDLEATGNFQVTVLSSRPPKVVHCKKTLGMGKCESLEERERLFMILDGYQPNTDSS